MGHLVLVDHEVGHLVFAEHEVGHLVLAEHEVGHLVLAECDPAAALFPCPLPQNEAALVLFQQVEV